MAREFGIPSFHHGLLRQCKERQGNIPAPREPSEYLSYTSSILKNYEVSAQIRNRTVFGWLLNYRVCLRFGSKSFYCGRRTIGVPGLKLICWRIIFIAAGERSVYRDSIRLSRKSYLLQEENNHCMVPGCDLIWYHPLICLVIKKGGNSLD